MRNLELLRKMADKFCDQSDPFTREFLSEQNVTADECFTMSAMIGQILYGFLGMDTDQQTLMVARGAMEASGISGEMQEEALQGMKLAQLQNKMRKKG